MKTSLSILLSGILAGSAFGQIITNGDFETGDLTGWTASTGSGESITVSAPNSSFSSGSYSALFVDTSSFTTPTLSQSFTAQSGTALAFNFDIFVPDITVSNRWTIDWRSGSTSAATFIIATATYSSNTIYEFRVDGGGTDLNYRLLENTWYRISGTFDTVTDVFSGSVSPTAQSGGQTAPWTGMAFRNVVSSIDNIVIDDADTGTTADSFRIDNIAIVPEPSTAALVLAGIGGFLAFRRRTR